jgi:hypothetical protein
MKRPRLDNLRTEGDIRELDFWLKKHYPYVTIDLRAANMPRDRGRSYGVSSIFLLLVATVLLGALTKFRFSTANHAIWLLVWMYGGPLLRWRWLNNNTIDKKPCLSTFMWGLFGIGRLLSVVLAVGVFGGLAAILTDLFSVICGAQFSLSVPIWMGIGFAITVAYVIVNLSLIRLPRFACKNPSKAN